MALMDGSAAKAIEMIDEITFGLAPTDPTMEGFGGYANPVSIKKTMVEETFPYLKGVAGTDRLQSTEVVKVSEKYEVALEVRPVDWSILPRILKGATKTTFAIGDIPYPMTFGVRMGTEYETITGCEFSKFECAIEEDKAVLCNVTALGAASSGFGTDYIGAGAHAADPTGNALVYGDMTGVSYDSAALNTQNAILDSIKFAIEYPLKPVKDISSTLESNIGGWAHGQRKVSLNLGLSIEAMDLSADLLAGDAHTFEYTLGGKTFTFSNIKWKGDFDQKLDADDLLGMELSSEFANITIT